MEHMHFAQALEGDRAPEGTAECANRQKRQGFAKRVRPNSVLLHAVFARWCAKSPVSPQLLVPCFPARPAGFRSAAPFPFQTAGQLSRWARLGRTGSLLNDSGKHFPPLGEPVARPLGVSVSSVLLLLSSVGWMGCHATTSTTLAQTSDGVTRSLPRTGDILQVAPDNVEGESIVDVPGAAGQPSLRIVTGTVKLDLLAQSSGFIIGPPTWAEVVVRFSLSPKHPLRGTLNSANGIAVPAAFDAPSFPDQNARIGFSVKGVNIEQLPNGEVIFYARVAVRGLENTTLMRIAYQANLTWTPGGAFPGGDTPFPLPATPAPK